MESRTRKIVLGAAIALGGLIVLASVAGLAYYGRLTAARKTFKQLETSKVADGLYVLKTGYYINCWIMRTPSGSYVAFDSGRDAGPIVEGCAALGIDPASVEAIFLTHSDKEHTGGIEAFPRARIYLSKDEVQVIDGSRPRYVFFAPKNKLGSAYTTLADGQEVEVGALRLRCVSSPGHTLGCMSYLVNGMLLTGDALSVIDGKIALFNDFPFVNMDKAMMARSIAKLSKVEGVDRVLTAHFGIVSDPKTAFARW
jgi:hydroxyacylglutathione hydrolase